MKESYEVLINNNERLEIKWRDVDYGNADMGELVNIDGTDYVKFVYDYPLPVVVKRNNIVFRVGGTFNYN